MHLLSHKTNVLRGSRELYADLKLITECGQSLLLHRVVAATASKKLCSLLTSCSNGELRIRNVKFSALSNIINFIYDGKITLDNRCDLEDFAAAYNVLKVNLGAKVDALVNKIDDGDHTSEDNSEIDASSVLRCLNCEKVFADKPKLQRHNREAHRTEEQVKKKQKYECEQCSEVYTV